MLPVELSETYVAPFTYCGIQYQTSYVAYLASCRADVSEKQKLSPLTPTEASRAIAEMPDVNFLIMTKPLRLNVEYEKFAQHPELVEILLNTDVSDSALLTQVKKIFRKRTTITITSRQDIFAWCREHDIGTGAFDENIIIANGVTDVSGWLCDMKDFNGEVTFSDTVLVANNFLSGCISFNRKLELPPKLQSANFMLKDCKAYNQPTAMPDTVTTARGFLSNAHIFNSSLKLSKSLVNADLLLYKCFLFNQPVNLPEGLETAASMFNGCSMFNQPIELPASLTSVQEMFAICKCFNQPLVIPETLECLDGLLSDCYSFNQELDLSMAKSCKYTLLNCFAFNKPLHINPDVFDLTGILSGAASFDQPIVFPRYAICDYALMNCKSFRQPLTVYEDQAHTDILVGASQSGAHNITNYTNDIIVTGYLEGQEIPPNENRPYRPYKTLFKKQSKADIEFLYFFSAPSSTTIELPELFSNPIVKMYLDNVGAATEDDKSLLWMRFTERLDAVYKQYLKDVPESESISEFMAAFMYEMSYYQALKKGLDPDAIE